MKTSDSHSWVIHSLPNRKLEKMSVCGILLVSKMYWPVLRCHQKSGSVIGWAARIKINAMKSKTSSRRVDNSSTGFRLESAEILTIGSSVNKAGPRISPSPVGRGKGERAWTDADQTLPLFPLPNGEGMILQTLALFERCLI